MSCYDECKRHVETIQARYDDLLDAIAAYREHLDRISAAERAKESPDETFFIALRMQVKGTARLQELLETDALDELIRFADRVIRIKHWEDGVFV